MRAAQTIRTWHQIGIGEPVERSDVFVRFIATWVAFNAIYCSRTADNGCDLDTATDSDQVSEFANDPEVVARHLQLLRTDPEYCSAVMVLADQGVGKPVSRHRRPLRRLIRSPENAEEVLMCVYQVRCNLFHGQKTPDSPKDRSFVKAAYQILINIIEPYVEHAGRA